MMDTLVQPLSGRRLLRASLQSVSSALCAQLLLLLSGPLVARLLGVENRGYLAALYAFGIIVSWLGMLGLPTACAFFIGTEPRRTRSVVRSAVRLFLVQAPVVTALLAIVLLVWERGKSADLDGLLYPMLIFPASVLMHAYALALLQGRHRFLAYSAFALLPVFLYAAGVVVLFMLGLDSLLLVVWVWVGSTAVAAIAAAMSALYGLPPEDDRAPAASPDRELLGFGLRAHLGHASPVATLPVDLALVGAFLSPAALGLYTVASGFTNLLRLSAESVGIVAYPAVAVRGRTRDAWRLLWRFFFLVSAFTFVVATLLVVSAPVLIDVLFGPSFAGATPIARLLVVATALAAARRILLEGLRGTGHPGAATLAEVAMYPWLLVTTPVALLHYGGEGLAGTLVIGYGLSLGVAVILAIRLSAWHARPAPFVPVAAGAGEITRGVGP